MEADSILMAGLIFSISGDVTLRRGFFGFGLIRNKCTTVIGKAVHPWTYGNLIYPHCLIQENA